MVKRYHMRRCCPDLGDSVEFDWLRRNFCIVIEGEYEVYIDGAMFCPYCGRVLAVDCDGIELTALDLATQWKLVA